MENINRVIYDLKLDVKSVKKTSTTVNTQVGECIVLNITLTDDEGIKAKDLTNAEIDFVCLLYNENGEPLYYSQSFNETEDDIKLIDIIDAINGNISIKLKRNFTSFIATGLGEIHIKGNDGDTIISNRFPIKIAESYMGSVSDEFENDGISLSVLKDTIDDCKNLKQAFEEIKNSQSPEEIKNNQADWNIVDINDKSYIKNKPIISNDLTNGLKSNYDTAYNHSQSNHAPINAQKNSDITKSEIEAKLTGDINSHKHNAYANTNHTHTMLQIFDMPTLSKVAVSGIYSDLINKPTIISINDIIPSADSVYSSSKVDSLMSNIESSGGNVDLTNYVTKTDLSTKVDKVEGKSLISDTEITRLASLKNYTHPTTHSPSIIVQDSSNRFVTDTEKATWNNKSNFSGSYADLSNKPTIPTIDVTKSYVDGEVAKKANTSHTHTKSQITDLGTIIAINDTTPSTTSVYSSNKVNTLIANVQSGGQVDLSSYATKTELSTKVDKVEGKSLLDDTEITRLSSVSNYTHPSTHSPSMIVQDSSNRFVTDTEKATWNSKSSLALGTSSSTAYRGDYGNTAYTHSQSAHAPSNAEANVQSDWNITDTSSDGFIKNKPTIPTIDVTKSYVDTEVSKKANTTHTHTKSQITDFPTLSTVATSGSYADLSNKPTIPTVDVNKSYVDTEVAKKVNTSLTINSKPLTSNITLDRDDIGETLVTKSIASSTLTLSTNMYQTTSMVTGTTIVLPTVTSYTEIHLFFSTTADLTLTFPSVKWQSTPSIKANKVYEIIFTYPNSTIGWIGGIVQYE